jgi:hypothetical protein
LALNGYRAETEPTVQVNVSPGYIIDLTDDDPVEREQRLRFLCLRS